MVFQDYALFPHLDVGAQRRLRHPPPGRSASARQRIERDAGTGRPGARCAARCRTSCRAASSSASRWPARWRRSRGCCCSTSRSPASTSTCASAWRTRCARILKRSRDDGAVRHPRPARGVCDRRPDRRDARRPAGAMGRRLHALPPAGDAFRRRLHRPRRVRAGADRRHRGGRAAGRSIVRTAAGRPDRHRRMPAARRLSRRPSATCCCAPTTSSTTMPRRCRRGSSARPSAARSFSTRCGWPAASGCWPTCRRTTTTRSANGSASGPRSTTW